MASTLAEAYPTLDEDLRNAYRHAQKDGEQSPSVSDSVIDSLATRMADSIDKHARCAKVTTTGMTGDHSDSIQGTMAPTPTTGEGVLE